MNASSRAPNSEDAALWFARRRRGVMTLEERAAFEAWQRIAANAAAMAELEQVWASLQIAQGHIGPKAEPVQTARPKIAASALLAVMCAVSIGIGVISYSGNPEFWTSLDWVDR